jgi:membrane protein implicated in regulation of membrane protease activity
MDFSTLMTPWLIWLLIGVALAFLELAMPGLIVIFFGVGALITSVALMIWDLSLNTQVLIFISSSVLSLLLLRHWLKRVFYGKKSLGERDGFDDFPQGVHVKVTKDISPLEQGRISYRGANWYAAAEEDISSGSIVEIVAYADSSHQVFWVKKIS